MGRIKVLRVIARLNIGGPAIQSILLTDALNNDEFESQLIAGPVKKGEAQMDFLLQTYNVRPLFLPELGREINIINDIKACYKIYKLIKEFKPHIVHTHTSKAGFVGRLAALFGRVPVKVHTFHGHTFYGYFNRIKNMIFLSIEKLLAKTTDGIVTISPLQRRDIVETYKIANESKCKIVFLGLDLDEYLKIRPQVEDKERIGFRRNEVVIGTVGRITSIKNHRLFLDIARLFYDSYENGDSVKFTIIGDGELKDEIIDYRDDLGLSEKVRIVGWQDDMAKFYSAFDIFLLTSRNEGTPVSMIEAMASSIPVVSANVGGISDILRDGVNGYLVDGFNKVHFVDRIKTMTADEAKRRLMGENARNSVKNIFHKDRLIKDMEGLYRQLLKEKGVST